MKRDLELTSSASLIIDHGAIGQFNATKKPTIASDNNITLVLKGRNSSVFQSTFSQNKPCFAEIKLEGGEQIRIRISSNIFEIYSDDVVDITLVGSFSLKNANIKTQGIIQTACIKGFGHISILSHDGIVDLEEVQTLSSSSVITNKSHFLPDGTTLISTGQTIDIDSSKVIKIEGSLKL